MRLSTNRKFIFLARPRTGSTTCRNIVSKFSDIQGVHKSDITKDFPFYNHITAAELKLLMEEREMNWFDYKKFCFARNPFDRVVSLYHHNLWMSKITSEEKSFEDYINILAVSDNILTNNLSSFISSENGQPLNVDVLRFENMFDDLTLYLKQFDINITRKNFPHLNKSESRKNYRSYYNDYTKSVVAKRYSDEISLFDYKF